MAGKTQTKKYQKKIKKKKIRPLLTGCFVSNISVFMFFGVFLFNVQFSHGRKVKQKDKKQTNEKIELKKKKNTNAEDKLGIFFCIHSVTPGTVSGILALSKSLELCTSSHCCILKSIFLVFSLMAAKFVLYTWIISLFVLIDIIQV